MTPAEFKQARQSLGLTQTQAALVLGYSSQSRISEVESGVVGMSGSAARLMQAYVDGYRPKDWPEGKA